MTTFKEFSTFFATRCSLQVALFFITFSVISRAEPRYKRLCYFTSWAQFRGVPSLRYYPYHVREVAELGLCTHISFAFGQINEHNLLLEEPTGLSDDIIKIKKSFPDLKVLLAIGGWKNAGKGFVDVVSDSTREERNRRHKFNQYAVRFLRNKSFDGLDINWEYPGARGSPSADKDSFSRWMKDLKMEFLIEGLQEEREPLILAAGVPATSYWVDLGFNVQSLCRSLDFVNLMSYDLHGIWAYPKKTGHHAGLMIGGGAQQSVESAVELWKHMGCPSRKILLGLPTYGRSFQLKDSRDHGLFADVLAVGEAGESTRTKGILAYNEVCNNIIRKSWKEKFHIDIMSPVAYKGDQWVSFDNEISITMKCNFIKKHDLGGAMIWSLDFDDFSGRCSEKVEDNYPLTRAMHMALTIYRYKPTVGTAKTITTTTATIPLLTKTTTTTIPTTTTTTTTKTTVPTTTTTTTTTPPTTTTTTTTTPIKTTPLTTTTTTTPVKTTTTTTPVKTTTTTTPVKTTTTTTTTNTPLKSTSTSTTKPKKNTRPKPKAKKEHRTMKDLRDIMKQASKDHNEEAKKEGKKSMIPDDPLRFIRSLGGKLPNLTNLPKIVRKPKTLKPGKEKGPKLPKPPKAPKAPKARITCKGSALVRYPGDCKKYIHCNHGIPNERSCPPGLVFNPKKRYCDWSYNVKGC